MTTRTRRHNLKTLTKSTTVERTTPPDVFAWLDRQFSFTLDVASTHANALCPRHFTREDNGLAQSWHGETAFMNPPFGKSIGEWVHKARLTCQETDQSIVVCVLPARVDAEWWRSFVLGLTPFGLPPAVAMSGHGVLCMRWRRVRVHQWFFGERVRFDGLKTGAPFPTAVVVFSSVDAPRPQAFGTLDRPSFGEVWL